MRIIAGRFKGRRLLPPPKGTAARPITALAKKSLFDTLSPRLAGASVADLYCGTGTIGLEALSRGARRVYFAERDPSLLQRLRRNIEAVGAGEACVVWAGNIDRRLGVWLAELGGRLDVAFVDPPYAHVRRWSWPRAEERLFAPLAAALSDDGVVVLRVPAGHEPPERRGALAVSRVKRYGDMAAVLLAPAAEGG
jgi:16S rRNA (guanine966-N2)-methyltransferase